MGIIACLVEDERKARLVFDDASRDSAGESGSWRSDGLYTWVDLDVTSIEEASDEYFRLIGENIVFRLLALRKTQD